MTVTVNDNSKIVAFFLTKDEQQDTALQEKIKEECKEYRKKKYASAVFYSGNENLYEQTSALLKANRKQAAAREVKEMQSDAKLASM